MLNPYFFIPNRLFIMYEHAPCQLMHCSPSTLSYTVHHILKWDFFSTSVDMLIKFCSLLLSGPCLFVSSIVPIDERLEELPLCFYPFFIIVSTWQSIFKPKMWLSHSLSHSLSLSLSIYIYIYIYIHTTHMRWKERVTKALNLFHPKIEKRHSDH